MTVQPSPSELVPDSSRAADRLSGEPGSPPRPSWVVRVEALFVAGRRHFKWLQAALFVVFLIVVVTPLQSPEPTSLSTPLNDVRIGFSYVLWGLWFPLVFLSVILFGRLWCGMLCPMGAAAEFANRYGLRRPIPDWIKWEGTPAISFIVITLYGQTLGVRDHPEGAAIIFGSTMVVAIVVGWLYGRDKRAWCRHMCPIGRVLGLYARLGAVQFVPKVLRAGNGVEGYSERGVCPTLIDLPSKSDSRHCIECFRCVNPKAAGGVHLKVSRPGLETENIRHHRADPSEAWFLFLDTGVALGGFLWLVMPQYQDMRQAFGEWAVDNGWDWVLRVGPSWLMSVHPDRGESFMWLDFFMICAFMLGCMVVLSGVLGFVTALSAHLAGRAGGTGTFGQRFTELGYQYAPIALMSLVIGLGAMMLDPLRFTVFGEASIHVVRGVLFALGLMWSCWLGYRILANQDIPPMRRVLPLAPGVIGSLLVGVCWWPAIFGI